MDINEKYHVYTGFQLGLHVAESILLGELGYRRDDILERLELFREGAALPSRGEEALLNLFPLVQNEERFAGTCHPVLSRAAGVVLDWHHGQGRQPG